MKQRLRSTSRRHRNSSPLRPGVTCVFDHAKILGGLALAACFVWSYWPGLTELWRLWQKSQDYSGGQMVPLVAAYVIWADRRNLAKLRRGPCWWGLGILAASQVVRLAGLLLSYGSAYHYSLILALYGAVLLVFGRAVTSRLKWVFLLLLLMIPLPRRVHGAISLPLQGFATASAVYGLELMGYPVAREGNVLQFGGRAIAVAEACSGLRMLTAFVIVAVTLAFVIRRPPWQKLVIVASSIPVAVLSNTLRLIATVILFRAVSSQFADRFFHDFAGLVMMPLAVGLLLGELLLLGWVAVGAKAQMTNEGSGVSRQSSVKNALLKPEPSLNANN